MKQYEITLTLLEDLHVGTGLGLGEIDDAQIRDSKGRPMIPATHIKGLLRDALMVMAQITGQSQPVEALFGAPGGQRGALVLTSAYLKEGADAKTLIWGSTRIDETTGSAREDTLRFFEYVPAGTRFTLKAQLQDDRLDNAFRQALARCTHLGKGRSRGHGRVKWKLEEIDGINSPCAIKGQVDGFPLRLRLILRNLESLALPTTAHPGNLIPSAGWIGGAMLQGAWIQALIERGELDLADRLADDDILWANAYPLPPQIEQADWLHLTVAPIPLSIGTPKQKASRVDTPWWWAPLTSDTFLGQQHERDMLADSGQGAGKPKRPKPFELICQAAPDQPWRRYRPRMLQRLRTRVPDAQLPQALFAQEELAEGTVFCADLIVTTQAAADALEQALASVDAWLRIGRGGRPVELLAASWLPVPQAAESERDQALTIWLHSDLVVRDRWLRFHGRLDKAALRDLLGDSACDWDKIQVDTRSDEARVHGFNAAAGLPRTPKLAIKAGSVSRIQGPKEALDSLRTLLRARPAWGELTTVGLGRLAVDVMPRLEVGPEARSADAASTETEQSVFAKAREWAQKLGHLKGVSKNQLDQAREYVLAVPDEQLMQLFCRIEQASERYGGDKWKDVIQQPSWSDFRSFVKQHSDQRRLLDAFFRWCRSAPERKNKQGGEA